MNLRTVCLGTKEMEKGLLDFLIISGKYFIYTCKIRNKEPNINHFINNLKQRELIEKCIATNADKIETHTRKWAPFFG